MGRHVHHLFDDWQAIERRLHAVRRVALFLDFDGTLVRIHESADHVRLQPALRQVLRRLTHRQGVTVWVITGRRYASIRERLNVSGVHYLGVHGWEIGDGIFRTSNCSRLMNRVRSLLTGPLRELPRIRIEDKGLCLAVHYRGAATAAIRRARRVVSETLHLLDPQLHLLHGKKVWELLPREVEGKGAAVRSLVAKLGTSTLPIYVGDDVSDEPAFAVLHSGVTARVGVSRHTAARFHLRHPGEVRQFLEKLEKEIP